MRKIRMGMAGGGRGAFIGAVHRMAAALDGEIELVCGAFSRDPAVSLASGRDVGLPDDRIYENHQVMFDAESKLPAGRKMDFVCIVTPNNTHFDIAAEALSAGFHVMSDKPATISLDEAVRLRNLVRESGLVYGLTHNYTGYPLVKEARQRVHQGELGKLRKVVVEYSQGWLSTPLEHEDNRQAAWRTDPAQSGPCGCMGDIGTHGFNLLEYVTGLVVTELCADLSTFVPGRRLDDDGSVLLRLNNGARGILHASQISIGEENELNIRVYGEKGSLAWRQQAPNRLVIKNLGGREEIVRAGVDKNLSVLALGASRIPGGHPEGFIEAFANLYRNFARVLRMRLQGLEPDHQTWDFPAADEGVRGMAFLDALVRNVNGNEKWTVFSEIPEEGLIA